MGNLKKYGKKGYMKHIFMNLCCIFPIANKAVFMSFFGKSYSDNPRAIYEQMVSDNIDMKYIWLMEDDSIKIPGAIVVKPLSLRGLFHQATAKLWIDNCRKSAWIVKRKRQYYIQTWHAGIAMKKVEKDVENVLSSNYVTNAKHDSKIADLFISGSKWNTENYKNAFWYSGEILESGLPRSDILYSNDIENYIRTRKKYNLSNNTKIILYAPTFRADGNTKCYNIDFQILINAVENRFGGNWKVLVKFHPNVLQKKKCIQYSDNVIDASIQSDLNELLLISDILITDYSSCMYDALNLGKCVFIYANDISDYMDDRGMYFTFDKLPFPLAQNNNDLTKQVLDFDMDKYLKDISKFKSTNKIFDDGQASKRVVEKIKDVLNI